MCGVTLQAVISNQISVVCVWGGGVTLQAVISNQISVVCVGGGGGGHSTSSD